MKKFENLKNKGFSLVEIVIAITTLVVVVVAATTLVVSSIQTTTLNVDNIIAYNLAQEGLEAVRNMRDSNWLSNQDYRKGGNLFWGSDFNQKQGEYIVEYKNIGRIMGMEDQNIDAVYLKQYAPWSLKPIGNNTEAKLYLMEDMGLGVKRYTHESMLGNETKYSRKIIINEISDDGNKIRVESMVFWQDRGRNKEQKMYMDLTNWKHGN